MEHIYGRHSVFSVLENPQRQIKIITIQEGLPNSKIIDDIVDLAKQKNVEVEFVPLIKLERKYSMGKHRHQGIVAVSSELNTYTLKKLLEHLGENPLLAILDHVNDPHNLGAIVRSAELAGFDAVIMPERRNAPLTNTVVKTSAGATEKIPMVKVTNINETIRQLKKLNIWVYGIETGGENIYDTDFSQPTALVFGAEGEGLSTLTTSLCDKILTIPMYGKTESLNVSVAAGISMFIATKNRHSSQQARTI